MLAIAFFTTYFVIADTPSKVFILSFFANISTLAIIIAVKYFTYKLELYYFFASQLILLIIIVIYYGIIRKRVVINSDEMYSYIKKALRYAWPIILNVFLFMLINNYGRIYAHNFLSREEMFHISFSQRICMLVQVMNVSILGYFAKTIFTHQQHAKC